MPENASENKKGAGSQPTIEPPSGTLVPDGPTPVSEKPAVVGHGSGAIWIDKAGRDAAAIEHASTRKITTSDFKVHSPAPKFKVEVANVVFVTNDFIVFLDTAEDTYWWTTDSYWESCAARSVGVSTVLNRVAELEAIPIDVLKPNQRHAFRTLVAEGVARVLDEGNISSAEAVHDKAERYVTARLREVARSWYLSVAFTGAFVVGSLMMGLAILRTLDIFNGAIPDFSLAVLAGSLGSAFSLLTRAGGLDLDPSAGAKLHIFEAIARILSGALGALIVRLAIYSGQFIPALANANLATLVLICIVSGVSERLVPNLISHIEKKVDAGGATATATVIAGPAAASTPNGPIVIQGSTGQAKQPM
jgi:hypothetical protein